MKHLFALSALIIAAGCQSSLTPTGMQGPSASQNSSSVRHLIWEPPPVTASNASDQTATFVVSSACDPVPWSPSSGSIQAGSAKDLNFEPNGNPCSYQAASIKAHDPSAATADECDLVVVGNNIDVVNNSNTDCQLNNLGSGKWGFVYKLISG